MCLQFCFISSFCYFQASLYSFLEYVCYFPTTLTLRDGTPITAKAEPYKNCFGLIPTQLIPCSKHNTRKWRQKTRV